MMRVVGGSKGEDLDKKKKYEPVLHVHGAFSDGLDWFRNEDSMRKYGYP